MNSKQVSPGQSREPDQTIVSVDRSFTPIWRGGSGLVELAMRQKKGERQIRQRKQRATAKAVVDTGSPDQDRQSAMDGGCRSSYMDVLVRGPDPGSRYPTRRGQEDTGGPRSSGVSAHGGAEVSPCDVLPCAPIPACPSATPMEVNLIRRTLDDLTERNETLRGFL